MIDEKRNITIIDRFRRKSSEGCLVKYYKIRCNICGFNSGPHYIQGEYREEWIVAEKDLGRTDKRRCNCPCCTSHITVPGINDIPTTASWMIPYFQGGYEEAKKYTRFSSQKKVFKCPNCNRLYNKEKTISSLYSHGLACICSDSVSYPNKFAYYLFEKLKDQYDYYTNEYSPEWAGKYRYDNYFVIGNKQYIVEMDGALGHGKRKYKSNEKDIDGLKRDKIKESLAEQHNIILIRVDCETSNKDYIWKNIQSSILKDIFDFSNINYVEIDILAKTKNIYKEICDFSETHPNLSVSDISEATGVSNTQIYRALEIGLKNGWTTFKHQHNVSEERKEKIIEYWKNNNGKVSFNAASKVLDASRRFISDVIKSAAKDGLVEYDPNMIQEYIRQNSLKPIYVYDKEMNFIAEYKSASECEKESINDFGIELFEHGIRAAANPKNKRNKKYKGFIFSYKKYRFNEVKYIE